MRNRPVITIVGGESLIGRELREVIREQRLPVEVQLAGVDEGALTLTEREGEPAVITPLDEENLLGSCSTILAGSADSGRKANDWAPKTESSSASARPIERPRHFRSKS